MPLLHKTVLTQNLAFLFIYVVFLLEVKLHMVPYGVRAFTATLDSRS